MIEKYKTLFMEFNREKTVEYNFKLFDEMVQSYINSEWQPYCEQRFLNGYIYQVMVKHYE